MRLKIMAMVAICIAIAAFIVWRAGEQLTHSTLEKLEKMG